ncbi:hypothetical protein SAMN04488074_11291 [Lentzea albidocapillata subsp. violacea]|uniref:Uncharacterized protein n=1 Tax=Lentzea albidocapillata subsp. violacea TaxID=128104 RepID=A0A1G9LK00_9PSEU|nr:hypothetical protein [Lentzea albidocapillata]SDL62299.1 hypothetical protein SAMN04488074_11291 [Lentzea albidocapillata subsp. violacea]
MTGVRRRGYFTAAVALMGAALIAALFSAPPDKPVDIRLVAPPPPAPEVVTATATTTVSAVGVERPQPPPPPPPPPRAADRPPQPEHRPPPSPSPGKPRPNLHDLLRCDTKLFGDDFGHCLRWPLDTEELCDFLEEHQLEPVEGRGRFELTCEDD